FKWTKKRTINRKVASTRLSYHFYGTECVGVVNGKLHIMRGEHLVLDLETLTWSIHYESKRIAESITAMFAYNDAICVRAWSDETKNSDAEHDVTLYRYYE
ncbi:hypothetical protein PFISCL1PPCAC_17424, partial [Pristionchus fissidentatus]